MDGYISRYHQEYGKVTLADGNVTFACLLVHVSLITCTCVCQQSVVVLTSIILNAIA